MPRNHRSARDNALQKKPPRRSVGGRNEVRIIGGRWRGRKLRFPALQDIRPSPDRVRETLFNWLAPAIQGARCLDLFAGSGALGLEALSRGAASAVLVDRDPAVARYLRQAASDLGADACEVVTSDAGAWLAAPGTPFDVVFLDPPFDSGLLPGLLERLAGAGWLAPGAFVYVECRAGDGEPAWPVGLRPHRAGRAGDVGYYLAAHAGEPAADGEGQT